MKPNAISLLYSKGGLAVLVDLIYHTYIYMLRFIKAHYYIRRHRGRNEQTSLISRLHGPYIQCLVSIAAQKWQRYKATKWIDCDLFSVWPPKINWRHTFTGWCMGRKLNVTCHCLNGSRDKLAANLLTSFPNSFSWLKLFSQGANYQHICVTRSQWPKQRQVSSYLTVYHPVNNWRKFVLGCPTDNDLQWIHSIAL